MTVGVLIAFSMVSEGIVVIYEICHSTFSKIREQTKTGKDSNGKVAPVDSNPNNKFNSLKTGSNRSINSVKKMKFKKEQVKVNEIDTDNLQDNNSNLLRSPGKKTPTKRKVGGISNKQTLHLENDTSKKQPRPKRGLNLLRNKSRLIKNVVNFGRSLKKPDS